MRVRKVKSIRSTAEMLELFRERVRKYYANQRLHVPKTVLMPSVDEFPPMYRHMAERHAETELKYHNEMLRRAEILKNANTSRSAA